MGFLYRKFNNSFGCQIYIYRNTVKPDAYCDTLKILEELYEINDVEWCPVGFCFCMKMPGHIQHIEGSKSFCIEN